MDRGDRASRIGLGVVRQDQPEYGEEIARAVRGIAAGEAIFGPGIAARVLHQLTSPPAKPTRIAFPELTAREFEILDLLAAATPTAVIAQRLDVTPKTISNHVSNILTRLQVTDRTQAALLAREAGLGRAAPDGSNVHN